MMKKYRRLLAIGLAMLLAVVPAMTAFAETEGVIEYQEIQEQEEASETGNEISELKDAKPETVSVGTPSEATPSEAVREEAEEIVLTAELDDVIVTLQADSDAFENEGELSLEVTPAEITESEEEALDAVEEENVAKRVTYDITVLDDGEEIEPVKAVKVSFELKDAPSGADGVNIYHHDAEDGIEQIVTENLEENEDDVTVEAETDSFSLYTVDFTYRDKTVSIDGDSTGNKLDDIVSQLGIDEKVEEATAYQDAECTEEAEDGEVKDGEKTLFSVYESGNEWYVDAVNAFNTEHGLVVKTADGAEYKIKVTDKATTMSDTQTNITIDQVEYRIYKGTFGDYIFKFAMPKEYIDYDYFQYAQLIYSDSSKPAKDTTYFKVNLHIPSNGSHTSTWYSSVEWQTGENIIAVPVDYQNMAIHGYSGSIRFVDTAVSYIDADGSTKACNSYTPVSNSDFTWGDDGNEGWYVVDSSIEVTQGYTVSGNVKLILLDGCSLTVTGDDYRAGICVSGDSRLTIYAGNTSSDISGSGTLTATGGQWSAGIGGDVGSSGSNITINGGTVTATGDNGGAGIGGGSGGSGSYITINGGEVNANGDTGESGGAGIGGGAGAGAGSNITINGGKVTATGGNGGAGIGGGPSGSGSYITINGGEVTATGGRSAAGIGGGVGLDCSGSYITIKGGEVTATGGGAGTYDVGAGIGNGGNGTTPASNIKVAASVVVKAGASADPATEISHTSEQDIAGELADKRYVTAAEKTPQVSDLTFTAPSNLVYNKSGKSAAFTGKDGMGAITVKYSTDREEWTDRAPVNAKEYYVQAVIAEGTAYKSATLTSDNWKFTISPATLTIGGATADGKQYDGTTAAVVHTENATIIEGLISGDDVNIASATGTFDTKDAGKGKTVTIKYTLGGNAAGNYTASNSTTTADIDPIPTPASEPSEEPKPSFTGSQGNGTAENPVTDGQWNCGPGGQWTFRTNGQFRDTWGYIRLEDGRTGWFWFDKSGAMATGWQQVNGKWYYFNQNHDGTYGMMLANTTTPDGYRVGADGAWIQ